jgi:hypothetical protein
VPGDDDCIDPVLEVLWKRILDAWGDERAHAALLDHAIQVQALPEIAGRYRSLVDDPEKGTAAKKRLDAIVLAATQMLMSMKTPPPGKTPWPITLSAVGVSLLLLSWLAYAMWGHN